MPFTWKFVCIYNTSKRANFTCEGCAGYSNKIKSFHLKEQKNLNNNFMSVEIYPSEIADMKYVIARKKM